MPDHFSWLLNPAERDRRNHPLILKGLKEQTALREIADPEVQGSAPASASSR